MVHVKFDPNSISIYDFETQIGHGEYNYFRGAMPFQRGYGQSGAGVGDFLRSLWRALMPSLKSAGKTVGREALSTGSRILEKVAQGEDLKETVSNEALRGIDNVLEKGGIRRQTGAGTIKKLKIHQHQIIPSKKLIGKKVKIKTLPTTNKIKKRNRTDAFGFY